MSESRRVALVTGASRGIGAAVARELARQGLHVVATARTQGGLESLDDAIRAEGGTATLLPLDIADGAAIDAIGPSLHQRFGRLDVLVSNAGVLGKLTPVPHILPRDFDEVVAVNIAAAWRLIRSCGPLLQAGPAGRAVFVTSGAARNARAYWGLYGMSKAALDHLVQSWAAETLTTRMKINLFSPGAVRTRMRAEAMPGEDPAVLPTPEEIAPKLVRLCRVEETRHGEIVTPQTA